MSSKHIYIASPTNKKAGTRSVVWIALLSVMLAGGMMLTLNRPFHVIQHITALPFLSGAAVLLTVVLNAAADSGRLRAPLTWCLRLLLYPVVLIVFGIGSIWSGLLQWLNCLISGWNTLRSGGVPLFAVDATTDNIIAIAVFASVVIGGISYLLASRRLTLACTAVGLVLLLIQLCCDFFTPIGCALYLCALGGLWMSVRGSSPTGQSVRTLIICTAILCAFAMLVSPLDLYTVTGIRQSAQRSVHIMRYGGDTLPEGDLRRADELCTSDSEMLIVNSEYEKTLYLRGYVGAKYEDGNWIATTDADYAGEHTGMLSWLEARGFDPNTQVSQYYSLTEGSTEPNTVGVTALDASRSYIYAPSSTSAVAMVRYDSSTDTRIKPYGMFGADRYVITEQSSTRPSELTVCADWVASPQTDEQKTYAEAEAVYRDFVYDSYTAVDTELSSLINNIFWDNYTVEQESIYTDVTRIRECLGNIANYTLTPDCADSETDPIRYFLTESHSGNAALYASVATQALRARGIPARYVEGYYVSSAYFSARGADSVTLTGKSAHAWTEVYFDGIGWLPVDVTPGHYYDAVALQQMIAMPDAAHKTAAIENDGNGVDEVAGTTGDNDKAVSRRLENVVSTALLLAGTLAAILLLITALFLLLELIRLMVSLIMRRRYSRADARGKADFLRMQIYRMLRLRAMHAHLGYDIPGTDERIASMISGIEPGEYTRVVHLIEKSVYGECPLEQYELRTLVAFYKKLASSVRFSLKPKKIVLAFKMRYGITWYETVTAFRRLGAKSIARRKAGAESEKASKHSADKEKSR